MTDQGRALERLADQLSSPNEKPVVMRIANITAVESAVGRRVQTNQTGTAWLYRSEDANLAVGDRVWLISQGAVVVVAGRLSGEPGAVPIGAVQMFAGASAPVGWLVADGSAISRSTYAALFTLLGTTYGAGNGTTTFNIPNLVGRMPLGVSGSHALGTSGGAETTTLSSGQLPSHSHSIPEAAGSTTVQSGSGATVANATSGSTGSVGSGSSVPILSPYLALTMIIRVL